MRAPEFRRLESHRLHTVTQRYLAALKEQELSRVCEGGSREFTLALLNVRSLSAHALDVARDPVLGKVDLLCLTETWNNGTAAGSGCEDAVVRGYDAAACARAVATRRAGGVDVFLKRYLPFSKELRQQRQSSLLVLDRRVCPSVSGGLCDDGADDAVNEYYFARSGKDGEYCGVNLVANVYGNLISHAVATSPVRDTSPYKDFYTLAYTGDGVFVVTVYLAPNLARDAVAAQLDAAMESVCVRSKVSDPVVLVGDFNVDVRKKSGEWLVEYMRTKYSMQCASAESDKCPTTIHGSCIDLAFTRNCDVRMLLKDPLTVHFSDHKAVIMAVRYNDNTNRC